MTSCVVCFEDYDSRKHIPKTLPCGHTICVLCLQNLPEPKRCPTDRRSITFPDGQARNLPTNYALLEERSTTHDTVIQRELSVPPQNQIPNPFGPVRPTAPPRSPTPEIIIIDSTRTHEDECGSLPLCNFARKLAKVIEDIHNDDEKRQVFLAIDVMYLVCVDISRLVAGSVKLGSDCHQERLVAIYLFVKFWFASVFWGLLIYIHAKEMVHDALKHWAFQIYLFVDLLFSLIWLCVGTHWIWTNFPEILAMCPLAYIDWSQHFINFAVFLHCVDWVALILVSAYSMHAICKEIECQCNMTFT